MKGKILLLITAIRFLTGCESYIDTPNAFYFYHLLDFLGNWYLDLHNQLKLVRLHGISDEHSITATYAGYARRYLL